MDKQYESSLLSLYSRFGSEDTGPDEQPNFNSSFLYHLRAQFARLFSQPLEVTGAYGQLALDNGGTVLAELANGEYRRRLSREKRETLEPSQTLQQLQPLFALSQKTVNENGAVKTDSTTFGFDGWRVARFMAAVTDGKVNEDE